MKFMLAVIGMLFSASAFADGYVTSSPKEKSAEQLLMEAIEKEYRENAAKKAAEGVKPEIKQCEECPPERVSPPPEPRTKPKPAPKPKPRPAAPAPAQKLEIEIKPGPPQKVEVEVRQQPGPPQKVEVEVKSRNRRTITAPDIDVDFGTRVDIGPALVAGTGSYFGAAVDATWFFYDRFALDLKLGGVRVVNTRLQELGAEDHLDRLYGSAGIIYRATQVMWIGANVEGIGRFSPDLSTKRSANFVLDLRFRKFVLEGAVGYSFGPEENRLVEPGFQAGLSIAVPFTVTN